MHRENETDVQNAKKALETICKNNTKFQFEIKDYENIMIAYFGELSGGKGGIIFGYNSDGMGLFVHVSDSKNRINYEIDFDEIKSTEWLYEKYQSLYELAKQTLNNIK